jgi:hypothetical protein
VGADPTIVQLTEDEQVALTVALRKIDYKHLDAAVISSLSYHIEVKHGEALKKCFTLDSPLAKGSGLFGQSTIVWPVFLDGQIYALKDSWQECHQQPESFIYDILHRNRDESMPLVECLGSIDLGKEKSESEIYAYGYKTRSATFCGHPKCDWSRKHLLLYPVGHHLKSFSLTRSLVEGIRDAATGMSFYATTITSYSVHR